MHPLITRVFAVAAALAAASLSAQTTYKVYNYTATVGTTTVISANSGGNITFNAGTVVTGQVYILTGVPNTSGWGYPGETASYVNSVASFSFDSSLLSVAGAGLGDSYVSNNRRFTQSAASPRVDTFEASLTTEPTTTLPRRIVWVAASVPSI